MSKETGCHMGDTIRVSIIIVHFSSFAKLDVLRDSAHRHINRGNFIPGVKAHHAVRSQIKNPLEFLYRILRALTEYTILRNFGNTWISIGDFIELLLDGTHAVAPGTNPQGSAGIRGRNAGNLFRGVDIYVVTVEVSKNLNRGISLIT